MLPKPIFNKAREYVRGIKKEYEAETVGKTGLAATPLEVGRQITSCIERLGVRNPDIDAFCKYMQKEGLLQPHPLGGWMVTQVKGAPPCPTKEEVKTGVKSVIDTLQGDK